MRFSRLRRIFRRKKPGTEKTDGEGAKGRDDSPRFKKHPLDEKWAEAATVARHVLDPRLPPDGRHTSLSHGPATGRPPLPAQPTPHSQPLPPELQTSPPASSLLAEAAPSSPTVPENKNLDPFQSSTTVSSPPSVIVTNPQKELITKVIPDEDLQAAQPAELGLTHSHTPLSPPSNREELQHDVPSSSEVRVRLTQSASVEQNEVRQSDKHSRTARLSRSLSLKKTDDKEKLPEKAESLRKSILGLMCNCDPSLTTVDERLHDSKTYISTQQLRNVLTRDALQNFFKLIPGGPPGYIEPLYDQFQFTIATLILMQWQDWSKFYELFYKKQLDFSHCDQQIPYSIHKLEFLFGNASIAHHFWSTQKLFKHAVLKEPRDHELHYCRPVEERLPFSSKILISDGNSPVYKITIDSRGLEERNSRTEEWVANEKPVVRAMKVYTKQSDFEAEQMHHRAIREKTEYSHRHIVLSITTFRDGEDFCSILPWAEVNLFQLLNGKMRDYGIRESNPFQPSLVLKQLKFLIGALKFLHKESGIIHLDIKSDNILIYGLSQHSCGVWKLADFGLSKRWRLDSQRPTELAVVEGGNYREERTSVVAPRRYGLYQPPEMMPPHKVNRQSDMFSIGAIVYVCWTFSVGGPQLVQEFQKFRSEPYLNRVTEHYDGREDLFYCPCDGGAEGFRLKPELDDWDRDHLLNDEFQSLQWPSALRNFVRSLMNMNRDERPQAEEAYPVLDKIGKDAVSFPQNWTYEPEHETVVVDSVTVRQRAAREPKQALPCKVIAMKPGIPVRKKVDTLQDVIVAKASTRWVVFVSPSKTQVFHLPSLLPLLQPLHSKQASIVETVSTSTMDVAPQAKEFRAQASKFEDACISGDYLALISRVAVDHGSYRRKVELWNLNQNEAVVDELPEDCFDVIVSARGFFAFVRPDRIELKGQGKIWGDIIYKGHQIDKVKKAAFSHDGTYLCVWSVQENKRTMPWRIFRYNEMDDAPINHTVESTTNHDRVPYKRIGWRYWDVERSSVLKVMPKSFRLCPTSEGQNFFAFSDDGRFWFINCSDDEEDWEERCPELISDRAHERDRIDLLFPLSKQTVISVSKDPSKELIRLSSLTRMPELTRGRHHRVLAQHWDAWPTTLQESVCDVQRVEFEGKNGILIVYKKGLLELRLLQAG